MPKEEEESRVCMNGLNSQKATPLPRVIFGNGYMPNTPYGKPPPYGYSSAAPEQIMDPSNNWKLGQLVQINNQEGFCPPELISAPFSFGPAYFFSNQRFFPGNMVSHNERFKKEFNSLYQSVSDYVGSVIKFKAFEYVIFSFISPKFFF